MRELLTDVEYKLSVSQTERMIDQSSCSAIWAALTIQALQEVVSCSKSTNSDERHFFDIDLQLTIATGVIPPWVAEV